MQESMCFSAFLYEYIESIMFLEVASRGGAIAPLAHPLNPPLQQIRLAGIKEDRLCGHYSKLIGVGNSTMTITTLILLLATGILAVTAVDNCPRKNVSLPITSCCELMVSKQFFTFSRSVQNRTTHLSGVYWLNNFCGDECTKAEAYCDTRNGGGGWLVVQRRQDGSVDFNRTWLEYEDGFGKLTGELWYGLRALHCLTGQGGWEMRMDIKLANDTNIFRLQYEQFKVASAKDKYRLTVGGFQGTTNDPMATHNGMNFTTKDSDNGLAGSNCALAYGLDSPIGGWWFRSCWVNGIAPNIGYNNVRNYGVYLNNKWQKFSFMEIKIRPHNCNI